jgi:hypothetical protein
MILAYLIKCALPPKQGCIDKYLCNEEANSLKP